MRIIGGEARGRKLFAPPGRVTRPVLDALKERVFAILGDRAREAVVLDLFCGPGSFGLEALSRGAASCTFVDQDRAALDALGRNLELLHFEPRARVRRGDAFRLGPALAADPAASLAFVDPPFPLIERAPHDVAALIDALAASMQPDARIVVRVPERFTWPIAPATPTADVRDHGRNRLELYAPATPSD